MTRDEIVSHPCRALTSEQREHYFERGFVALESLLERVWLQRMRGVLDGLVACMVRLHRHGVKLYGAWSQPRNAGAAPSLRPVRAQR